MSIFHYDIEQLKQKIETKMNHKYVDVYIERPEIDLFQLEILYHVAYEMKIPEQMSNTYITATMLVQTALNAHELVQDEETHLYTDRQKKEKQLLVLAGDYYSGLYYLLLSEMKDVDMVGCLAKGIKKVNEYKMQLYYNEYDSIHGLIQLLIRTHSTIIAHVTSHLFSSTVSFVMEKLVQLHFLCTEKNRIEKEQGSVIASFIDLDESIDLGALVVKHIRTSVSEIEAYLQTENEIPSSLKDAVQDFLNNEVYGFSSMAEEG